MLKKAGGVTTIPIVFTSGGDPINPGLVSSLNHPGGNLTGGIVEGVFDVGYFPPNTPE